jgi:predicted acylesterase/phospholipase RssA
MSATTSRTSFFHTCLGVFQGGGCRAAAYAGAYEAATAFGVHFAGVAGTSAGSIAAVLVGAGATPDQLGQALQTLDFSRFTKARARKGNASGLPLGARIVTRLIPVARYRHLLLRQGMYSPDEIQAWIEEQLRNILHLERGPVRFRDLVLPTWVVATDLATQRVKVWDTSTTPEDEVAEAVTASCAIPFFFQPVRGRYVDGGALSNLPAFVFPPSRRPLARRVLAFTLLSDESPSEAELTTLGLISSLTSSIVDGAQDVQLKIQPDVHVISIPTGKIRATDFHLMDPTAVQTLFEGGRKTTQDFFGTPRVPVGEVAPP